MTTPWHIVVRKSLMYGDLVVQCPVFQLGAVLLLPGLGLEGGILVSPENSIDI